MINVKIDSTEENLCSEITIKGSFLTLVGEYTMIGVRLAEMFAEKDPNIAKRFETLIGCACVDGLLTDPENAVKEMEK